jgi:hypothetical protein
MTQVDHDLTAVNCFDQQLGLIRNLGHHSRSCVPWPGSAPPPSPHGRIYDGRRGTPVVVTAASGGGRERRRPSGGG